MGQVDDSAVQQDPVAFGIDFDIADVDSGMQLIEGDLIAFFQDGKQPVIKFPAAAGQSDEGSGAVLVSGDSGIFVRSG